MSYVLITTELELADACKVFSTEKFIAIDTEFKRETSYFPIPCLFQMSASSGTVCVDLLAIQNLSPLKNILFNQNILKIFHAARQDLELFYYMFNQVPSPIYDTQIGASFLGNDNQIGYANLVKKELNITLDKSQTRTDWTKRPITKKQLDYAANDVIYLFELYLKQYQELTELGRLSWCEHDFQRLTDITLYKPCTESAWTKVKNYHRLTIAQKCIVYELAKWRESEAISSNKTRNAVLKNTALLDIAFKSPSSLKELESINDLNHRTINTQGPKLLSIINSSLQMDIKQCPSPQEYSKLSDEQLILLRKILQSIESKSQSSNIDSTVICSKKELEKVVRGKRDSILFDDWRFELVGKEILNQLQA